MRGLAACLLAGALMVAGCGSSGGSTGAQAPKSTQVATTGSASGQAAAVSAQGQATPKSLCTSEGTGKPHKQCVAGLTKLGKGTAKNPNAACKGLSKKKTKGVKGKSPFAVCVTAAAKLMAAQSATSGNGSADTSSGSGGSGGNASGGTGSTDTSASDSTDNSGLQCVDENGNPVSPDDPNVADCTDTSAQGSGDTSTDSTDTSTDSTDTSTGSSGG